MLIREEEKKVRRWQSEYLGEKHMNNIKTHHFAHKYTHAQREKRKKSAKISHFVPKQSQIIFLE